MDSIDSCRVPKCLEQRQENNKLLCSCYLFKSDKEMTKSLIRLCYGNLFVAGSVWIHAMQSALLGTRMPLFPIVQADEKKPEEDAEPPKPEPMKFTELPLNEAPHAKYKAYLYAKSICPEYNNKLIHPKLLPHVTKVRTYAQQKIEEYSAVLKKTCEDIRSLANMTLTEVCKVCRDDANLLPRRIAIASSAALGFYFTSRKRFLWIRKLSGAGISAIIVGSLCFPDETDEAVRTVGYYAAKTALLFYNLYEGTNVGLNKKLTCSGAIPEMPPPRPNPCGEARAKKEAEMAEELAKINAPAPPP